MTALDIARSRRREFARTFAIAALGSLVVACGTGVNGAGGPTAASNAAPTIVPTMAATLEGSTTPSASQAIGIIWPPRDQIPFPADAPTTTTAPDLEIDMPGAFLVATSDDGANLYASGDGDVFQFERGGVESEALDPSSIPAALTIHGPASFASLERLGLGIPVGSVAGLIVIDHVVWATDFDGGRIIGLGTDGTRTVVEVPGGPRGLAFEDGDLWTFTEHSVPKTLVRIDPHAGTVVDTIPVPSFGIFGLGAFWTADQDRGEVSSLDPITRAVTATFSIPHAVGCNVNLGVVLDEVWAWCFGGPYLDRIDPTTMQGVPSIDTGGKISAIAMIGADAWVLQPPGADHPGRLLRIDPEAGRVDRIVEIGDLDPDGGVVFDGGLWFAVDGQDRLVRIPLSALE